MLNTAIIPQDNIVFLPTKSSLETQLLAVFQEKIKRRTAFIFRKLLDSGGECSVDIERFSTCLSMGSDHRMNRRGIDLPCIIHTSVAVTSTVDMLRFMQGAQAITKFLEGFRKLFIGLIHIGKKSIPSYRRQKMKLEHRSQRRLFIEGNIGMPESTIGNF